MSDRARRARQREDWPGGLTTLAEQADAAIVRGGTAGERVAMVWRITLDVWASSGRPLPSYSRSEMPGRVIRPRELEDARRLEALGEVAEE